jgi:ATP-dependent RNA helicase SUPV3L1/SUV3
MTAASRILAVLGPTNTGKTHFAVERMLAHRSGMMGFPLRLLAREIFDRVVGLNGPGSAALITGEERVGPETARYLICTVEAMPLQRPVSFLGIDEIQLCADRERGHVFTDRLLNARGLDETIFLGSDTIRPLLRRLVPQAEIITRPRFSILTYGGEAKLHRLPRRSAIVGFTAADVYALAEVVRRQKGGAAVVLGALSPRTRNAQVALYQAGEVDHLVATDAIGMGLNMDLAHVAFADLRKFDGQQQRRLTTAEIAQIAGRAGRHMADGTFGTTGTCGPMDDKEVEAVESHSFPPLKALRWRNSDLDFSSLTALSDSLDEPPPAPGLIKVRDALDDRSLAFLVNRPEIRARADRAERVRLLWQVCQIPDFTKALTDSHLHLLATVFGHLTSEAGVLPSQWFADRVARLERTDGDIDALVSRIAHVRTWTYISYREGWLADAPRWQDRAREVEDRLSDALHERLTQRFVDRRTSALLRSLREKGEEAAHVEPDGDVLVDDHLVGRLEGLSFVLAGDRQEGEPRLLATAARKAVTPALRQRARELATAKDDDFSFRPEAEEIVWRGSVVSRLRPSDRLLMPRVEVLGDPLLDSRAAGAARQRLADWLASWLAARLAPLHQLETAAREPGLSAAARGVAYRLHEDLGCLEWPEVASLLPEVTAADRRTLGRLGVRVGWHFLFLPALLKPTAIEARLRLWRLAGGLTFDLPPVGRTVLRGAEVPPGEAARVAGFASLGDLALRVDVLERLAATLRALGRGRSPFVPPPALASEAGLSRGELQRLIEALGYRALEVEGETAFARLERPRPPARRPAAERKRAAMAGASSSPFAVLARLKMAP